VSSVLARIEAILERVGNGANTSNSRAPFIDRVGIPPSMCAAFLNGISKWGTGSVRESSQVLQKVFQAVREEFGSPNIVASAIGISPAELSDHIFGLVPIGLVGGGLGSEPARPALHLVPET
jgi:hypothetical protein